MIKSTKSSKLNDAALSLSKQRQTGRGKKNKAYNAKAEGPTQLELNEYEPHSESLEISDILSKRFGGVSVYGAVMFLLAVAIVWTAVETATQVQQYHTNYMALQKLKHEHRKLLIENQRLIIEQQTFSATPQIASRAITQLGMYSPSTKDKLILQPAAKPENQDGDTSGSSANQQSSSTPSNSPHREAGDE